MFLVCSKHFYTPFQILITQSINFKYYDGTLFSLITHHVKRMKNKDLYGLLSMNIDYHRLENVGRSSGRLSILYYFNKTRMFTTDFSKTVKYKHSWKSNHLEPSCSRRTNGQKNILMFTVDFRNFANAPENATGPWILSSLYLKTSLSRSETGFRSF